MAELIDFGAKVNYSTESPMRWGSDQVISGANKIREFNRQRAVENAISKNYDPETLRIDENGIAQDLAAKGFGGTAEQVINQLKAERTKVSSDMADAMAKDWLQVQQKIRSPENFFKKWGTGENTTITASIQAPESQGQVSKITPQTVSDNQVQTVSEPPIKKTALDDLKQRFPTSFNFTPKDATSDTYVETPSSENVVSVDGSGFTSRMPEGKLQDIIPQTTYTTKTENINPTTTPTWNAIDMLPRVMTDDLSKGSSSSSSSSTISTEDMTPNEKEKLTTFLRRSIIDTKNLSLDDAIKEYEKQATESVIKPVLPIKGDLEDQLRYQKEESEYNAKKAEALRNARKEMRGAVGEIQGTDIQSAAEKRAEQKYRSEMQRVLNPLVFDPSKDPPTQEGANRVYDIVINFDDIRRAGESTGNAKDDFRRAWNAAVAKGKIDKNTTLENIVANLVAMGAMPDRQSAIIKKMLETNIDWQSMAADKIADYFAKNDTYFGFMPKGANPDWVEQQRKTYSVDLKLNNAYPLEQIESKLYSQSTSSTQPQKSGAKKQADDVMKKAKDGAAAKKGSSKPNPRGTVD